MIVKKEIQMPQPFVPPPSFSKIKVKEIGFEQPNILEKYGSPKPEMVLESSLPELQEVPSLSKFSKKFSLENLEEINKDFK